MKKLILSLLLVFIVVPALAEDTFVIFNTKSLIYHVTNCSAVKRCTKNCIKISKNEAISKKGRPCKICNK